MASNLGRLFRSTIEMTRPRASLSSSNSASRLISTTTQRFQIQQQQEDNNNIRKQDGPVAEDNEKKKALNNPNEEGVEEDGLVNKQTGEIGGPRGPEPTRYGDWERNGRCYDF